MNGTVAEHRAQGFTRVTVWCVGPNGGPRCDHKADVPFDRLPPSSWAEVSARLKCTRCGSVGFVDVRLDWSEIVDFKYVHGYTGARNR